jgi:phosphotriesterase-related protein
VEFLIPPFFYVNFVNCISIYSDMKLLPATNAYIESPDPVKDTYTCSYLIYLALFLGGCLINGCRNEPEMIMTVNGPLAASELGTTLPHEHFLVDFIGADSTGFERWDRDTVVSVVLPFLREAKKMGVESIVECTPAYLGRDPVLLQRLSKESGLNIITNTGYYGAINNKALPKSAFHETADQIAGRWIDEWENGIGDTGIRPGFIKIAVPPDSILSPLHEKLLIASARTHLKTGLTINSHTGPFKTAMAELDILKKEGVDPSAFIWTHAQNDSINTHLIIARMGAWVSLDNVMENNIPYYLAALQNLKKNGLLNRVLISHDAGWYDVINPTGVIFRGYTVLFTHLKPALLQAGFTESEWNHLVRDNPEQAYTIRIRKL